MKNEMTITVDASALVEAINSLVDALARVGVVPAQVGQVNTPAEPTFTELDPNDDLPWSTPHDEPAPVEVPPKPEITFAMVKQKVMHLCMDASKKDAVKACVMQYADKVSTIPEDKYPALYAELDAME